VAWFEVTGKDGASLKEFSGRLFDWQIQDARAGAVRHTGRGRAWSTPVLERTIDMAKFIYLYRGAAPDVTPEQAGERMAAFAAWMQKLGPALVDGGSPFGASASVRDDGTEGTAGDLIGYTIVEADDLATAKAFTDGLPFLSDSDGKCTVEIFELLSV
jgi:hypothetical protein